MDNILLEDDMKELKARSIFVIVASTLALAAFIFCLFLQNLEDLERRVTIAFAIISGVLFLYSIYTILFVVMYKVEVYGDRIYVRSLFSKKTVKLTSEVKYSCKKINALYSIFKITVGNEKITVRTKKVEELTSILKGYTINNPI